jgi:Putative restriction endonuclease
VPLIALEFVSGDGSEERDNTSPFQSVDAKAGKFWVYEQAVKVPFYGIYEVRKASIELYQLIDQRYQRCVPNERGHYPIPAMGVELGIWQGGYMNQVLPWLSLYNGGPVNPSSLAKPPKIATTKPIKIARLANSLLSMRFTALATCASKPVTVALSLLMSLLM